MKKIIFTLFLLCSSMMVLANPISGKKARRVAYNYISKKTEISIDNLKLVYGQQFPKSEDTAYFVFSEGNSAFVIVAGDDISLPIWAYSVDNGFGREIPDNVKAFLDDLTNELQAAREQGSKSDHATLQQWLQLTEGFSTASIASGRMAPALWESVLGDNTTIPQLTTSGAVAPLITTHWQQDAPYNGLCPLLSNGTSHSAVGCGAVAVAQILRYWQYPETPRGMHINLTNATSLSIDFDTVTFDYSLMPTTITMGSPNTEKYEVARLLHYCGVAMDMIYSTNDSVSGSAVKYFAPLTALVSFFRYGDSIGLARKANYSDTVWENMLRAELRVGHPIIYRGGGSSNHIFVCDGFDESNRFHFNMGHGGWDDGYYLLSSISMPGQTFNYSSDQLAILGIVPDSACFAVTAQKHGISKFIVYDTLDVYRQRTLITRNGYQFSNMESDRNNHTMIFVSGDTTKQLKIEALNVSVYGDVRIYDGENMDTLIDGSSGYLHSNQYPMYSTMNSFVIRDSAGLSYNDYVFRLTLECSKVSGLGYNINGDTLQLFWNEMGNASNWQVEYGLFGFHHGEGILVNTDTTTFCIIGLASNRLYDFYVRSVCGNSSYSDWVLIRIIVPPIGLLPWKDIVTSQPEGYQLGADGNIYIYSNEGLAWLISVCSGFNGATRPAGWNNKSIFLMADVDMSSGLWEALDNFPMIFDGGKHSINGLTIFDTTRSYSSGHGFIKSLSSGDTIKNTLFADCSIVYTYIHGSTGGVVASCHGGTIMNCGITGQIVSSRTDAGGIVGTLYRGNVINCFSLVNIFGRSGNYGGSVGKGFLALDDDSHTVLNCYSGGCIIYDPLYSSHSDLFGVFIGEAEENANASYLAYWLQRDTTETGCGNNASGFSPFELSEEIDTVITITDDLGNVLGYQTIYDTVWNLVTPTTIAGQSVSTLVDALNAWVDSNNTNGEYRRWTNDTDNINKGFPVFDVTRYQVSLLCDTSMGSVVGGGIYAEGSVVTISAMANNCYHFIQWSDGNSSSTRTIMASQDISLTAIFAPDAPSVSTVYVTECDHYSWKDSSYSISGVYTFDTLTALGCDSIVNLTLTINYSNLSGNESITACNSFTWNGTTYNSSGTYTYSTSTTMGCDSLVTLNLVIGNVITVYDSVASCDSYQWNGATYNSSGTYAFSTTSVGGCDSIVILYLTINYSDTTGRDTVSSCDSYTWQGSTFYESGIYQYIALTIAGCDSMVTLNLTINHPVNNSITEMACDSIVWENETYTSGGTYMHTLVDANGCTQTDTLYLTLNHSTSSYLELVIASSAIPYNYYGVIITGSGEYTIPMTTVDGCDSIIHLYVVVDNVGIESVGESDEIIVYPNPASSLISIVPKNVIDCVEIYDAIGRLVVTEKGSYIINISNLPNGAYTMRIVLPNTQYIKKIIKQ